MLANHLSSSGKKNKCWYFENNLIGANLTRDSTVGIHFPTTLSVIYFQVVCVFFNFSESIEPIIERTWSEKCSEISDPESFQKHNSCSCSFGFGLSCLELRNFCSRSFEFGSIRSELKVVCSCSVATQTKPKCSWFSEQLYCQFR